MQEKYNDFIGEMLEKSGEKDNYQGKGKGKPLSKDYLKRDVYQNFQQIAKDAGFLPPWLKLQKEISILVHACKTESELDEINEMIRKHNTMCPSQMQKNVIDMDHLERAKERW